MTKTKQTKLIQKGFEAITRIFMKYDVLGKRPVDIGNGIKISASNIHTIEAIGKGYGTTVTSLSNYFMITKGAVSQVVSKLQKDGYIKKTDSNSKTIILELTDLGKLANKYHDKYNEAFLQKLVLLENKYSISEIESFINILTEIDGIFGETIDLIKLK